MTTNLTDKQKDLLRWIVQQVNNNNLDEEFTIAWVRGGKPLQIMNYKGDKDSHKDILPNITQGALDALEAENMLLCNRKYKPTIKGNGQYESYRTCTLTNKAYEAVDNDFKTPPPQTEPSVNINIQGDVSGANIQAIGTAQDTEISQIINNPDLLHRQVGTLTENLLNEVKSTLNTDDLTKYTQAIHDLKEQLLAEEPNPSIIKQSTRTLSLLGDIEGTIGLMTRIWQIIHPLLFLAAAKLEQLGHSVPQ